MWTRLAALGLGAIALIALTAVDATEQDFRCEETAAHLKSCCTNFDPQKINCTTSGCNSHPMLTVEESQCLLAANCTEVGARHLCERVQALGTGSPTDGGPFCPSSAADSSDVADLSAADK